jgi:hypothetical protein
VSSLAKRIEKIEQSPHVQREQRCIHAVLTPDYSTLTDDDLDYVFAAYRQKYGEAYCDRLDAWFATLSDVEVEALAEGQFADLNAQTRAEWDALSAEAGVKSNG